MVAPGGPSPSGGGLLAPLRAYAAQPGMRRLLPWFVGIAGLGLAALAFVLMSPAPQRMLYASLSDGERATVAAALEQAGIAYNIDPGTGAVTVGEGDLYRARMTVASQGALAMPETGAQLIDSLPMGASRTLEGDRLRAAQERELQLTIMEIDGVEAVRVHLAKAERSVFVRETSEPTASVMLRLVRGQTLSQAQVRAIANLVAASVVGLSPDRVRIVDQNGTLLSDPDNPDADGLDLQARTEAKMREQLASLLTPIVGAGAFSTQVQVELDMNELTQARESYDPQGSIRAETTSESSQVEARAMGVPGATTNLPPAAAQAEERAPEGTQNQGEEARTGASNASRTFEVGREVSVTSSRPGQVRRISVAVAIDEAALGENGAAELAKIEGLVAAAVGANTQRGDTVTVVSRAFQPQELAEPAFWETPWFATIVRNVVALLSVLLILLLAVRPLLKAITRRLEPPARPLLEDRSKAGAGEGADAQGEEGAPTEAGDAPEAGDGPATGGAADGRRDQPGLLGQGEDEAANAVLARQIEAARRIAREQPDDAVQALRRMLRPQSAPADEDATTSAARAA